ncbi:hypothetical protein GIB67_034204 [Kingdonia uniflora]|uniref:Gamma-tubulin complex component n=1 Tax=Kingdonia uniflora TaxID=39325 RepID=A0A7J7NS62_9MAGN|nr:hypothetical protein GIB67_034204 [Kingdonia uniflora]
MAANSNFSSLLQNLKLEDPWLSSKPWESIKSESGVISNPKSSNSDDSKQPLYKPSMISEVGLVSLVVNALQGVEFTLRSIEKMSEMFCNDPADRTKFRTPSLWNRSLSSCSLGKILKSIGRAGFIAFLVRRFVEHLRSSCSLVNQAFSVAMVRVLEGYVSAIDTVCSSVELRRSSKMVDGFGGGCLTNVANSEITLIEVYLHTKELRNHIEALGNICLLRNVSVAFSTSSSIEDLTAEAIKGFCDFPRGANLLTYLYTRLRS